MTGKVTGKSVVGSPDGELLLRLWPSAESCGTARHAVRAYCVDNALPQLADDAELLTSELVTNAIEHCGTLITLVAMCTGSDLIVNVRDDDSASPGPVVTVAAADAEDGRGMHVVETLAGSWGTSRHGDGKSVWFRLP